MRLVPISELDDRDQKRVANARAAMERGNFEYAVELCSQVLSSEPNCLEARRLSRAASQRVSAQNTSWLSRTGASFRAFFLSVGGNFALGRSPAKAMRIGELALSHDPYNAHALSLIAKGAKRQDMHEVEAFCLEGICERFPENASHLHRLCEAWIKIGETEKALSIAERLTKLKPGNARMQELVKAASVAHSINRGKWAEDKGDFRSKLKDRTESESLERLNQSVVTEGDATVRIQELIARSHQDPQNIDTCRLLVRAFLQKDDLDNAIMWLDKAFALPDASADTALLQLRSDLKLRRAERDLLAAESAGESGNSERVASLRAQVDELKLKELSVLVEQFPNDYSQRLRYGQQLLASGEIDQAIQQFQVSLRSPSLKQDSMVLLGESFMAKGLYDLALERFVAASESAATMDAFKKKVTYLAADCLERLNRREEAMSYYKQIYASDIGYRDVASKIDAFYSA